MKKIKIEKIKVGFKGKLINLVTKKIRLTNGYLAHFETIEHPGASLVIPFIAKDRIIIIKQLRPVINRHLYELPAGTLQGGESTLSCARREIIEEIGYSARRFIKLGQIYPVPGYSTEKITIYKAQGLRKREVAPEKDELIKAVSVSRRKVKKLFRKGDIIDAKTICALTFCGWL